MSAPFLFAGHQVLTHAENEMPPQKDVAPQDPVVDVVSNVQDGVNDLQALDRGRQLPIRGPLAPLRALHHQMEALHMRQRADPALQLAKVRYGIHIPDRRGVVFPQWPRCKAENSGIESSSALASVSFVER